MGRYLNDIPSQGLTIPITERPQECPKLDRVPAASVGIVLYAFTMHPRFDVFSELEDDRVQFLGTTATLEEAEQLARAQKLSVGAPCFVLHSAFGNSSRVTISI
jgi:ABC-type arginine transport system ATPase subunit